MFKELTKFIFKSGVKAICGLVVLLTGIRLIVAPETYLNYVGILVVAAYLINVNFMND
jgi:hypothetical protein